MRYTKLLPLLLSVVLMTGVVNAATIRGTVTCDGKGVANVVVTDGISVTCTNEKGAYKLKTNNEQSRCVVLCQTSIAL